MDKHKVTIVGGGMAGLTAAFELTRTPELRARYEVTLYQLGWRVGGKCASGRDEYGRNIEHGLHIWFGYYENAFRLLREVYGEWRPPAGQRITSVCGAVQPQAFTPVGDGDQRRPGWYGVIFRTNDGEPGRGQLDLSVWSSLVGLLALLSESYDRIVGADARLANLQPLVPLNAAARRAVARAQRHAPESGSRTHLEAGPFLKHISNWAGRIDGDAGWSQSVDIRGVVDALREGSEHIRNSEFATASGGKIVAEAVDIAAAFAAGLVTDVLLEERELDDLDKEDFRSWLVRHGAQPASTNDSPVVKALYDTMFQYPQGKLAHASYGAGTAVQVVLRMLGTYQGSVAWELQAGTGEVIVAPLFQVLQRRGVTFSFFHKLRKCGVDPDQATVIETLVFDRQVNLNVPEEQYQPLKMSDGLIGWGAEPEWDLIVGGAKMRAQHVDLESHWCNQNAGSVTLKRGDDFDDVILAIPLGAFKSFGSDESPCSELMQASEHFRTMTERLDVTPSISVQAWCSRTLKGLGWTAPKPALVSGPKPLDIWADMSQLLAFESRPSGLEPPASLHYFCDVFDSALYRCGADRIGVPEEALRQAHPRVVDWFERYAPSLWTAALQNGKFDWNVLYSPANLKGPERLAEQVLQVNINPSDCCTTSAAGSSAARLKTDQSGIAHLYLAGSWIDTGLNTECIEAAVMSGMQAARAISGQHISIPGEYFLHPTHDSVGPCDLLRRYIASALGILQDG